MLHLYCHVEESSMEETLHILLPRLVGQMANCKIINHGSKEKLLKNLPSRLQGYREQSKVMKMRVLVLVDRDDDDCLELKSRLEKMAEDKGLGSKSNPDCDGTFLVVNRIVVEELESWFFGDVPALCAAYPRIPTSLGEKKGYKNPDAITGGTWEALHRVLKKANYYDNYLPKIEVARMVSPHMKTNTNRSASFQAFLQGLEALLV